jgi:hypothetical protein
MAGIKKGGIVGDEPKDFERPASAFEGVRMHVNHMAAHTLKRPIERVMNLGENRIGMRIPRSAWFLRDLRFPHS